MVKVNWPPNSYINWENGRLVVLGGHIPEGAELPDQGEDIPTFSAEVCQDCSHGICEKHTLSLKDLREARAKTDEMARRILSDGVELVDDLED